MGKCKRKKILTGSYKAVLKISLCFPTFLHRAPAEDTAMIHHNKRCRCLPSCKATKVWEVGLWFIHPWSPHSEERGWLSTWIACSDEDKGIGAKTHNHRYPLGAECSNEDDDYRMLNQASVTSAWRPGPTVVLRVTPSIFQPPPSPIPAL